MKIKIIGSGSAGNHIAHAFSKMPMKIVQTDLNVSALKRSINFPTRLVIKHLPQQGLVLGIHSPHHPVAIEDIQPFIAIYWLEYEKVEAFGKLKWIKTPKQALTEKLGNITIGWHPQGFFQTNRWVANQMFSKIKHWIINNKIKNYTKKKKHFNYFFMDYFGMKKIQI